jgi:hypothetical protein
VTQPAPGQQPFSGRAAFAITQTYYYIAAVVGVGLLLGGGIAALIAFRQWILPSEVVGPSGSGSREAVRSLLGALAFAIPGGLVLAWHLGEARRRERSSMPGSFWGSALYFHLVALISLFIAVGGVITLLHSVVDAALPQCFGVPRPYEGPLYPGEVSPIPGLSPGPDAVLIEAEEECYPQPSDALRSALDATIVASVAGGVWLWHLRRGRREPDAPPPA